MLPTSPMASLTRTVNVWSPALAGLPVTRQPLAKVSPDGRLPLATLQEYGGEPLLMVQDAP